MPVIKIQHPYTPYKVNAHFSRSHLCSVRLKGGCYRVLHLNTGLTIGAFKIAQDAKALILRISRDEKCDNLMGVLQWSDYKGNTNVYVKTKECVDSKLHNLDVAYGGKARARYSSRAKIL